MTFKIGTRNIGNNEKPYCIAEVGINHNGSLEQALKMIQVAKEAGSDAIKFQTFKASEFCGENQEFTYMSQGKVVVESMLKMFQRHEFNKGQWSEIKKECDRQSITFLSTPQNYSDLKLLLDLNI